MNPTEKSFEILRPVSISGIVYNPQKIYDLDPVLGGINFKYFRVHPIEIIKEGEVNKILGIY